MNQLHNVRIRHFERTVGGAEVPNVALRSGQDIELVRFGRNVVFAKLNIDEQAPLTLANAGVIVSTVFYGMIILAEKAEAHR
jgi:hypothetical protein